MIATAGHYFTLFNVREFVEWWRYLYATAVMLFFFGFPMVVAWILNRIILKNQQEPIIELCSFSPPCGPALVPVLFIPFGYMISPIAVFIGWFDVRTEGYADTVTWAIGIYFLISILLGIRQIWCHGLDGLFD